MSEEITALIWLYIFICVGGSIPIAFQLEKKLKEHLPRTRPYKWGFFFGCINMACAPLALLMLFLIPEGGDDAAIGLLLFIYFGVLTLCGYFIIKRKRWAWVVGTILQFNIISWIINGVYQKNRWCEFKSEEANLSHTIISGGLPRDTFPPISTNDYQAYYIRFADTQHGPWNAEEIRRRWNQGKIPGNALYWRNGMSDWKALATDIEII